MRRLWILPIRGYQRWISPMFPPRCKYHPTCSEYARLSIQRYGAWSGGRRALGRLVRCQPFGLGGVDLP